MRQNSNKFFGVTFSFLTIILLASCEHYCEPEIFLIPENYKGTIYIIYNQKDGVDKEYENGKRVYRIPSNGILLTKFRDEYGIINQEYYYLTKDNTRRRLTIMDTRDFNEEWTLQKNPHEPSRDSLAIFNPATTGTMGDKNEEYKFQQTFIGTYNDIKKERREIDHKFIDSLKINLIKNGM